MIKTTTLGLCLAMTLSACGKQDDDHRKNPAGAAPKAVPTNKVVEPTEKPAAAWQPFTDEEYGFAIDSPHKPTRSEQPTPTDNGIVTTYVYQFSPPGSKGAMMVSVTPGDEETTFDPDAGQTNALATMGGKLVSQKEIELDGHPGREFHYTATPQGMAVSGFTKMFFRDHNVYQVLVIHTAGDKKFLESGQRFASSFRFTEKGK